MRVGGRVGTGLDIIRGVTASSDGISSSVSRIKELLLKLNRMGFRDNQLVLIITIEFIPQR